MKSLLLYCLLMGPGPLHPSFTTGHNQFAFRLLNTLSNQEGPKKNIAISPLGVYLSIGMLYNAADNDTRDSIAEALGTSAFGEENLNTLCQDLMRDLSQQDDRSELVLANSIWSNKRLGIPQPSYENICERFFYSPIHSVNFGQKGIMQQMNKWADQSTHHSVQNIVGSVDMKDHLYLVNAASFRSDWVSPFDVNATREDVFQLSGGRARSCLFMQKEMVAKVYTDTAFTMVGLPYGSGSAYSLYIVVPDDPEITMNNFLAGFGESRLYDAIGRMNDQWVDLSMPRFEYSYAPGDMKDVFRKMGMGIVLNDYRNADLSKFSGDGAGKRKINIGDLLPGGGRSGQPGLSRAFYKTSVSVNEKGMLAGDPVSVSADATGVPVRRHRVETIHVDRPFFYAVISRQQKAIVIAGVVNDPGKN